MSAVLQPPAEARSASRWEKYRAAVGGLSEYWYPLTTAAELRRKKRQVVRILGKNLVLFYEQRSFYALLDQCAHRKVPLSMGRIEFPGHISCIFHGWTYELKSGEMVAALTDGPSSPVTRKACVRTFPCEERAGLVFVWMGEGKPVPVEDDVPAELLRPDARVYPHARLVEGNWRHAAENGFDEGHVKMVHRTALWVAFRNVSAWNETYIERSPDGVWLRRKQKKVHLFDDYPGLGSWPKKRFWKPDPGKGTVTGGSDHGIDVRLPAILRVKQPGSADWTHYEWYVPIDENHYYYLVLAVTWRSSRWQRAIFWLRYWTYILWIHHYQFNNQDLAIVGAMPESSPWPAYRPDESISAWRKLVEDEARQRK
jgi:phenylpropionate dioxygenase-like ring-hydroxylating dioxygenase large terminal subunit